MTSGAKPRTFVSNESYEMPADEEFAYGIEQFNIKKHVWDGGHDALRGVLLRDPETGKKFFVTEADEARYRSAAQHPADRPIAVTTTPLNPGG